MLMMDICLTWIFQPLYQTVSFWKFSIFNPNHGPMGKFTPILLYLDTMTGLGIERMRGGEVIGLGQQHFCQPIKALAKTLLTNEECSF